MCCFCATEMKLMVSRIGHILSIQCDYIPHVLIDILQHVLAHAIEQAIVALMFAPLRTCLSFLLLTFYSYS